MNRRDFLNRSIAGAAAASVGLAGAVRAAEAVDDGVPDTGKYYAGPVFDFRIRPCYKGYMNLDIVKSWRNVPKEPRRLRTTGFERRPVPSVDKADVDLMMKEMEAAGVVGGVLMGRETRNPVWGGVPNEDLYELTQKYPGKLYAFAGICPYDGEKALAEIEKCVKDWKFKGVSLDPGWCAPAVYAHDERIFPIYELCESLGVPVAIAMSAYTGPDLSYTDPTKLIPVMKKFKNLQFVICHAAWPKVQEMMGVCAACPNVWLVPDAYFYVREMPFGDQYVRAANGWMKYRTLFGTGYPIRGHEQVVENWCSRGLEPEALRLTMYENAKYLLKL